MRLHPQILKICFSAFMVLFTGMTVLAQQQSRGRITNETGEPLQGVTVTVKGTTRAVATNAEGNFSLETAPGNTLVLTFTGYKTKEVPATATVNTTLEIEAGALSEVVIIGYQTVQKKDLTGAVSIVNVEDANKVTSNSVAESIQGLAAGVSVLNTAL